MGKFMFNFRNRNLLETFKCMLALSLGVTLKTLYDLPADKCECPKCTNCEIDHELLNSELHFQLREAFVPRNVQEVLQYEFFNMSHVAASSEDEPFHKISRHQKVDIKDMVRQIMPLFNSAKGGAVWRMLKLENGYRRFDPLRGQEYVIDAILSPEKDESHTERHRFEMVKPFGAAHMVQNKLVDPEKMIHFIVPVSKAGSEFLRFMKNFENVCLKTKEAAYLLILLCTGEEEEHALEYNKVKAVMANMTHQYRNAHIRIIHTKKKFLLPFALDLGSKQLPPSSLLLFSNADTVFTREFLSRCRLNAIEGHQVYYPVGFAQYSPNIVSQYSNRRGKINFLDVNKNTGFWSMKSFEVSCMHNSDYRSVKGFNSFHTDWDTDLCERQIAAKLKVFRAMDPGLTHVFKNETCPTGGSNEEWRNCMDTALSNIGSRQQLSRMLMKYFV